MKKSYDVLIVGVGGQGVILASNILGDACVIEGRHIRCAETHGMSQRGGSVEAHIRIDGKFGSLISPGSADLLIAFDALEALRYRHFLKDEGVMVVNHKMVVPTSIFSDGLPVPQLKNILAELKSCKEKTVLIVDATEIATKAGNPLVTNVVLIGTASHQLPLALSSLILAVRQHVPQKMAELNELAFEMGRDVCF